ncbi:MAG: hypothetical protein IT371_26220 [Deltaproteobacteria bacterium]|nr:hypothetical protein [Deltaproteobacteria bacterium]
MHSGKSSRLAALFLGLLLALPQAAMASPRQAPMQQAGGGGRNAGRYAQLSPQMGRYLNNGQVRNHAGLQGRLELNVVAGAGKGVAANQRVVQDNAGRKFVFEQAADGKWAYKGRVSEKTGKVIKGRAPKAVIAAGEHMLKSNFATLSAALEGGAVKISGSKKAKPAAVQAQHQVASEVPAAQGQHVQAPLQTQGKKVVQTPKQTRRTQGQVQQGALQGGQGELAEMDQALQQQGPGGRQQGRQQGLQQGLEQQGLQQGAEQLGGLTPMTEGAKRPSFIRKVLGNRLVLGLGAFGIGTVAGKGIIAGLGTAAVFLGGIIAPVLPTIAVAGVFSLATGVIVNKIVSRRAEQREQALLGQIAQLNVTSQQRIMQSLVASGLLKQEAVAAMNGQGQGNGQAARQGGLGQGQGNMDQLVQQLQAQ